MEGKVSYASSSLKDATKTWWTNYLRIEHQGSMKGVTFHHLKTWLENNISDSPTRTLEAISKLHSMQQGEN